MRCNHASDREREYVENAIRGGLSALGFSDHAPYVFEGEYYSSFRMKPRELDDYVYTISRLKREYAGDIEIFIGLEAEYYPRFFDKFIELIRPYPIEYLLLGQHFMQNELDGEPVGVYSADERKLRDYVSQVSEGLSSGAFTYFAHPDMFNFAGDERVYAREMRTLLENAKRADVPLEINLLGIRARREYPRESFWRIAGEVGNQVVFGSDAHAAADVCDQASYKIAMGMVNKYNLRYIDAPVFKRPCGEASE